MKYDKAAIVVLVAILCSLILLPFVVFAITTISTPWGFINDTNREAWIGYYGAIIGGALTLGGVWWTIKKQEEEKKMEFDINNCPLLTAELLKKSENLSFNPYEEGRSDKWYLAYSIDFTITLKNAIPACNIHFLYHDMKSTNETIFPRLWVFENNLKENISESNDFIFIRSKIDYDPGINFINNRQETSENFINKSYFIYSNPFGKEYILEVTHQMICHAQKSNCTNTYDFSKDYDFVKEKVKGEKIYYSEFVSSSIITDEEKIMCLKSRIRK